MNEAYNYSVKKLKQAQNHSYEDKEEEKINLQDRSYRDEGFSNSRPKTNHSHNNYQKNFQHSNRQNDDFREGQGRFKGNKGSGNGQSNQKGYGKNNYHGNKEKMDKGEVIWRNYDKSKESQGNNRGKHEYNNEKQDFRGREGMVEEKIRIESQDQEDNGSQGAFLPDLKEIMNKGRGEDGDKGGNGFSGNLPDLKSMMNKNRPKPNNSSNKDFNTRPESNYYKNTNNQSSQQRQYQDRDQRGYRGDNRGHNDNRQRYNGQGNGKQANVQDAGGNNAIQPGGLPKPSIMLDLFKDPKAFLEFQKTYGEILKRMEEADGDPEKLVVLATREERRLANEQRRAEQGLPIYLKRKEILDQILNNKFSIVVGDTGCGKSTQLPQYLFEHYEQIKGSKILWVLPRKLPALSLSARVCDEMGITLGQEIGFEVPNKNNSSTNTLVKFITDTILINELIVKRAQVGPEGKIKLDYSLIVLDEVHERNLYTDILLATLKDIALGTDMKMLVTSATINESLFEKYFDTKAIQVKGRPHPVEIEYNPIPDNMPAVAHMANNVFRVVRDMERPGFNYRGHILVFTSGVDDIIKVSTRLEEMFEESEINKDKYEILPLHGLLAPDEQQAVFSDVGKIKIILSTRMAETALTINGVRVVLDIGYDKETMYDAIKRMTITENKPIAQSSAIQRTGRAGRTSPGMCIRLYSEEEFEKQSRNKVSEIQRMNIGKVILKLKALGVGNLKTFDFIEKPNEEVLAQTIEHLMELGALSEQDETLTPIGKAMLKLETDPDFSKVIIEGLRQDCEQDVIEIIAMIGVNPRLYRRGFDDDTKEAADKKKFGFCHEKGDLLTLWSIYTFWVSMDKPGRQRWCKSNYFSFPALNEAYRTTKELNKNILEIRDILKIQKKRPVQVEEEKKEDVDQKKLENDKKSKHQDTILKCFLAAFYPNVCLFTGIPRVGYTLLRDNLTLRLHGASSLSLAQEYPKYIFCIDINKTGYNNSKLVSVMQQAWLDELFFNYKDNPRLKFLANSYIFNHFVIPKLSPPLLGYFAYNKLPEIQALSNANSTETTFFPDLREEKLHIYSSLKDEKEVLGRFQGIIDTIRDEFENTTREVSITLKTRGIFKTGGEVKEILLAGETVTLSYDFFDLYYTKEKLEDLFGMVGEVVSVFQEIDTATNLSRGIVTMKSVKDVEDVLNYYTTYRISGYGDPKSDKKPIIAPICYNLTAAAKRSLRVRIEWFTGESQCSGCIRYNDVDSADEMYRKFDKVVPLLDGDPVVTNESGRRVPVLNVRKAKDRKQLVIDNMKSVTDAIDIERMLREERLDKGYKSTAVFRNETFDRDMIDQMPLEMYTEVVKSTILKEVGIDEVDIYRIEGVPPKQNQQRPGEVFQQQTDFKRRVEVDVYDLDVAKKIIAYFDGNTSFKQLTRGKIHASLNFSRRYALRWTKYRVIEKELNALIERFRESKGSDVLIMTDQKENAFSNQDKETGIRIVTSDPMTLDECCNAIQPIVWGAPFYLKTLSQVRKAEVQAVRASIAQIEKKQEVSIDYDKKRRQLKVFGPDERRQRALVDLQNLFNEAPKGFQKVKVSFKFKPARHILENNGAKLVEVEQKFGVRISYSLMFKEITIYGSAEKVNDAEKAVIELVNSHGDKKDITENECPICFDTFTDGYRLQVCGHKYCFSCLEAELSERMNNTPEFPMMCSMCVAEKNETPICIKDLMNVFAQGNLNILWERSMEDHLRKNGDQYFRCLTPDCPQIFRKSENKTFSCDYCLKSYCKECKKKAHGTVGCEDAENEKEKVMEALKGKEAKECPKCRFLIEKNGGCSQMQCIMCHTIFCWQCKRIFTTEGEVHAHLDADHHAYG